MGNLQEVRDWYYQHNIDVSDHFLQTLYQNHETSLPTFIFSLDQLKENTIFWQQLVPTLTSVAIGQLYEGMGCCTTINYEIQKKAFFLKCDGGPNGWECRDRILSFYGIDIFTTCEQDNSCRYVRPPIDTTKLSDEYLYNESEILSYIKTGEILGREITPI